MSNIMRKNLSAMNEVVYNTSVCNIDVQHREIYFHSYMDNEEDGIDYRSTAQFIKNLRTLDKQALRLNESPAIIIHMITPGGEWEYGMAAYDAISSCSCPVIVLAYAHSRSMSSIIPQAADLRIMMPHSLFMIHEGTLDISDTSKGAASYVELNNKLNDVMLDIYYHHCCKSKNFKGKTESQIKSFLRNKMDKKQEWYITAEEAVDYGFMDGILGTKGFETIDILKEKFKE